ncbi:MAG TPA: hypothetical protein VHT70_05210 [Candidatus Saccharimonadales bacterium]|jgi:hypothetical protein|nr:hypothetical protein [Candidatus Saccharimonadales bacterium]
MILLCAGVIALGSTFTSLADSLFVTATVPASPPPSAAILTSHFDQQHVTQSEQQLSGTCPTQTYVELYSNGTFHGASQCQSGAFQIQANLFTGANQLQVKVYNVTDTEGPASPPITLYYDQTSLVPAEPPAVPTAVSVTQIETSTYRNGSALDASERPTISGFAPPYAFVTVTFHSEIAVCKTRADGNGWWACTLDQALTSGEHTVDIAAVTTGGKRIAFPTFHITVRSSLASLAPIASQTAPITIIGNYRYQARRRGEAFTWDISITGGAPPYVLSVDWRDAQTFRTFSATGAQMTISHAFANADVYQPIVQVIDAHGQTARLQLSAVVKGPASVAAHAAQSPVGTFLARVRQYLWIVWPVYGAVVLMTLSFWLGELEVTERLMHRAKARAAVRRHRSR